jgi:POT family proton-dependent oligopeptide transporter
MTAGMLLAGLSFVAVALIQRAVEANPGQVSVLWQAVPYVIITVSEVLVSATGLEFAYSQAPRRMKSTVMSLWYLFVSLGNKLVAVVALIQGLSLENFFWLFAGLMAAAGLLFGVVAYFYTYRDYTQE